MAPSDEIDEPPLEELEELDDELDELDEELDEELEDELEEPLDEDELEDEEPEEELEDELDDEMLGVLVLPELPPPPPPPQAARAPAATIRLTTPSFFECNILTPPELRILKSVTGLIGKLPET